MKNNLKLLKLLIFVYFSIFSVTYSNEFIFETNEINIYDDGNITEASEGTVKSIERKFIIRAKKFIYNNKLSILDAFNGIATSKEDNLVINAKKFIYNNKLFLLSAFDGIATSKNDNLEIEAKKFVYDEKLLLLQTSGDVLIRDLINNISIKSQNVFFDKKNKIVSSKTDSEILDALGNILLSKSFSYDINNKIIKVNDSILIDRQKNQYKISKAFLDLNSNRLIGKDISIDFNNSTFLNTKSTNNPRLKGKSISFNSKITTINKGVFTTCKKNDSCPPWQFFAEEIKHDKIKKRINYKNAWLKIYDKPVFYFPKFFHPDPTVKRQSGFLMPSFNNSSSIGSSLQVPYYLVTGPNKDFTFTPRFYSNEKLLLQAEHRKVDNKSKNLFDFSFLQDKSSSTKSHFFSKSSRRINLPKFDESEISIDLQQTSQDTYLKTFDIKSPLIKSASVLTSSFGMSAYRDDFSFDTNFIVYEDLNKERSDRYEYIYPSYAVDKKFNDSKILDGSFSFQSNGYIKNYDTNIKETVAINDLIFNSSTKYTDKGFTNNYNFLLRNINTDSKNSPKYKKNVNYKLSSIMEYNMGYPLNRVTNNNKDVLKPKISLKYSPNKSKNMKHENRRIDINNIFSINRLAANDAVEGGMSFTYGIDYLKIDNSQKEFLGARIANILRLEEDFNLPKNSTLGQKTSNIVGDLNLLPNDNLSFKYNFLLDENLKNLNYQSLEAKFSVNNFVTKFEYLNENNTNESESFLTNTSSYTFSESNIFSFKTRENKKTKATEFYDLMYQYKNDCLVAAIEYNRDYYTDRDLKPEENIFFRLTIVPFGETKSPNLIN
jgi:LPS-assembly protein